MKTLVEVCEVLKQIDEFTLLEILNISSEEIVDNFQDKIEESYDKFAKEFEDEEDRDSLSPDWRVINGGKA